MTSIVTDSNGGNGDRDGQGRFRPGSKGGPGNPRLRQLADHQRAVREALQPEELKAVLRKLHELAIAGDVAAARVLLDRVVGKARPAPPHPPIWTFDTQEVQSEAGRAQAIRTILAAVVAGEIPPTEGVALIGFLQAADKALAGEFTAGLMDLISGRSGVRRPPTKLGPDPE